MRRMERWSAEAVAAAVRGRLGRPVLVFATIGSTNDEAKRLAEAGAAEGTLVLAETQTAGRGRQGRQWPMRAWPGCPTPAAR